MVRAPEALPVVSFARPGQKAIYGSACESAYAHAHRGDGIVKRVGEVVRTAQGLAVVRCAGAQRPDVGATLLDDSLDPVGRVVDVFGPVDRPYAAVSPGHGIHVDSLLGEKLYAR